MAWSSGTVWLEPSGADYWESSPFPAVPHWEDMSWGHSALSLTIQNSSLAALGTGRS